MPDSRHRNSMNASRLTALRWANEKPTRRRSPRVAIIDEERGCRIARMASHLASPYRGVERVQTRDTAGAVSRAGLDKDQTLRAEDLRQSVRGPSPRRRRLQSPWQAPADLAHEDRPSHLHLICARAPRRSAS